MGTITIQYKSGQTVKVKAEGMKVMINSVNGSLMYISWTKMIPNPLYLNANEVESIWEE